MEHPGFFNKAGPFMLSVICNILQIDLPEGCDGSKKLTDVKPLNLASSSDIAYFENKKLIESFVSTNAGLCLVSEELAAKAPDGLTVAVMKNPQEAFAKLITSFYPGSMRTQTTRTTDSLIDESAVLEKNVEIEAGAIIGREVHIGEGTRISAGSVIGYRCHIGRNCMIGPNTSITHSLIGNNITIHAGASIGQDGFGYIMGPKGHKKVPQIGRVIIQDSVDIGANTTIDRGALADTIIGEGTKIDNLVQIAHNVVIGCHAVIVSQVGISGSTVIEDFVALGGQVGTVGHITIGTGAQIAAASAVHKDVPAGMRYGGIPAKPMRIWFKEIIALERLAEQATKKNKAKNS